MAEKTQKIAKSKTGSAQPNPRKNESVPQPGLGWSLVESENEVVSVLPILAPDPHIGKTLVVVLGFEGGMGGRRRLLLYLSPFLALHLNYWMWDDPRLFLGFPANLLYHVVLSFLLSIVMLLLVARAWPRYLDED
jgi:hypothetical protein